MRAIREHRLTSLLSFSISSSLIASWARPEIFVHVRIHLQREYFEFHLEVNGYKLIQIITFKDKTVRIEELQYRIISILPETFQGCILHVTIVLFAAPVVNFSLQRTRTFGETCTAHLIEKLRKSKIEQKI